MPVNMIAETGSSLSKVERISSKEDCSVLMIESRYSSYLTVPADKKSILMLVPLTRKGRGRSSIHIIDYNNDNSFDLVPLSNDRMLEMCHLCQVPADWAAKYCT